MTAVPALLFVPLLALGTTFQFDDGGRLEGYIDAIQDFINDIIIPFLIVLAGFFVIYGILLFIMGAGDDEKRKKGKDIILYGIIGLVVIFVLWGAVNLLVGITGLGSGEPPEAPGVVPN